MAYVTSTPTSSVNTRGFVARIEDYLAAFRAALETRRVFRTTLTELQALSTRDLADMGLNPSNLRQIAWETAIAQAEDRKPR